MSREDSKNWLIFLGLASRVSMLLCTLLVGILTWNAIRVIDQVDTQEKGMNVMMQHMLVSDGKIESLQTLTNDHTADIQQLQNAVFFRGRK